MNFRRFRTTHQRSAETLARAQRAVDARLGSWVPRHIHLKSDLVDEPPCRMACTRRRSRPVRIAREHIEETMAASKACAPRDSCAMRAACTRHARPSACRRLVHAPSARYSMMPLAMLRDAQRRQYLPAIEPERRHRYGNVASSHRSRWSGESPPWRIAFGIAVVRQIAGRRGPKRSAVCEHRRRGSACCPTTALESVIEIFTMARGAVDHPKDSSALNSPPIGPTRAGRSTLAINAFT